MRLFNNELPVGLLHQQWFGGILDVSVALKGAAKSSDNIGLCGSPSKLFAGTNGQGQFPCRDCIVGQGAYKAMCPCSGMPPGRAPLHCPHLALLALCSGERETVLCRPHAEFKTTDQLFNTKIVVPRVKAHFQRGDSDVDEVTMQRIASLGLVDVTYDVLCESHGSGSDFDVPHRVWYGAGERIDGEVPEGVLRFRRRPSCQAPC